MKNIIIVGDSFCANVGWPNILAINLNLKLIQYGIGGGSWWTVREFLTSLPKDDIDNCDVMVFVHTSSARIPTADKNNIHATNWYALDETDEKDLAIKLYLRYIQDQKFLDWATDRWYEEINKYWSKRKTIHLHAFSESWRSRNLLGGMQVFPDLMSISMSEISSDAPFKTKDSRHNHLSNINNIQLADQLTDAINKYTIGEFKLDIGKFI
jgi:hypothetical protein